MAASPNMHQHFDCLGSEEYHISHFLIFFTRSNCQPSKLVGEIWLTSHKYHRNFPLWPRFHSKNSCEIWFVLNVAIFFSDVAHQDTLVQVIHTVIFAMQKCQVPISSGLALGFLGSHMGMTILQSFGPGPCGLGHIHWEITNFRCILLGEPSWKSFHGCWIVAKEHSSVSKQPLQPVFLGDVWSVSTSFNISTRCWSSRVAMHTCLPCHYVWARILQNTWQSHFQYTSLFFMAWGIFVFIF